MVFYRKYRPQKISELDLTLVREKFTHLLESKDIPHAFLFTGPKGLGKTSSARILAKAINCQQRVAGSKKNDDKKPTTTIQIEPCNTCDLCISITNGSHVDVLEIDAASNRGIDEIRELRERIKFSPAQLDYKIYIIDEVHMLTTEAFNALLKTLEEPPKHVIFILCTTEEWKIPSTISSRTFHVRFEKPSKEEIKRSLKRIIKGEKIELEEDVLDQIYGLSDGAFRNAAKTLEELVFQAKNKKITSEILEEVFKVGSIEQNVNMLLENLLAGSISESLFTIQKIAESGVDFKVVHEKLVELLHEQLLIKNKLKEGNEIIDLNITQIKKLLELIDVSYSQLRFTVLPQLPLEIAVLDFFSSDKDMSVVENVHAEVTVEKTEEITAQPVTESVQSEYHADGRKVIVKLIDAVKKENHSVAGILRSCSVVGVKKGVMTIGSKFKFHGERLSDPSVKKLLEKCATEVMKKPTKVEIVINS